jgi:predicted Ser/Thr protein kinase
MAAMTATGEPTATITDDPALAAIWDDTIAADADPGATIRPKTIPDRWPAEDSATERQDERTASYPATPHPRGGHDALTGGIDVAGDGTAATAPAATTAQPGEALAIALAADQRYRLLRPLATGGMGVVLVAEQASLKREVAVKIIKPELAHGRMLANFLAEARCNANLEHPNIVPVYDAGKNFLVMKRIRGATLEDLIRKGHAGERLTELVEVLLKVCDAVAFAHSKGIIHRDLKPENVMVGEFGEVILMDWGLALAVADPPDGITRALPPHARELMCAGTPGCMAPEMARAQPDQLGFATDVFLLGSMLYRCLTARFPFQGRATLEVITHAARNDYVPVMRLNPRAPSRLVAVQVRAMASAPGERGQVADFAAGLRAWLQSAGSERDAAAASRQGQELLELARATSNAQEAHRLFAGALAACDRAVSLCPDSEDYRQLRRGTQEDYSRLALSNGDLMLAKLLVRGTPVHLGHAAEGSGGSGPRRAAASTTTLRAMSAYAGAITERLAGDLTEARNALERARRANAWLRLVAGLLLAGLVVAVIALWLT